MPCAASTLLKQQTGSLGAIMFHRHCVSELNERGSLGEAAAASRGRRAERRRQALCWALCAGLLLWGGCDAAPSSGEDQEATASADEGAGGAAEAPAEGGEAAGVDEGAESAKPATTSSVSGDSLVVARLDLKALLTEGALAKAPRQDVSVVLDPFYKEGPLQARGVSLDALLAQIPNLESLDKAAHSLRFVCGDGYRATASFESLANGRAVVAETLLKDGAPVAWPSKQRGKGAQDPGPYYLLWEGETFSKERPWPYQWVALEIIKNDAEVLALAPPPEAGVEAGLELFKVHCRACHSMNLNGGVLGPELNVPQNIMTYREREQVAAFIKAPQSFRAGSMMPAVSLDDAQLAQVLDYVTAMGQRRVCTTMESCQEMLKARPR